MKANNNGFHIIEDLMYNKKESAELPDFRHLEFNPLSSKFTFGEFTFNTYIQQIPYLKAHENLSVFAFDTGNNLGYAWIFEGVAVFGNTILVKDYSENPYPNVVAYDFAYQFIEEFSNYFSAPVPYALVEGSAMRKSPSQEFLSQVRSALFLGVYHVIQDKWLPEGHRRAFQVAPLTARKVVLKDGKRHPTDFHPQYNANAMDALTLAWYGLIKNGGA